MSTLYLRLGGRAEMHRVASVLLDLMRYDDILAEELDRCDHAVMQDRLWNLLVFAFGGSPFYDGGNLRFDFQALLRDGHHYDRFAQHFEHALHARETDAARIAEAMTVIELMRDYVLRRQLAHTR